MTREQYDSVAAELGLTDSLPDGCLLHVAGVGPDGSTWRDINAMERAGATPIWGPPANWEVHKLIVRAGPAG
jgi:hypothetical protein